MFCFPSTWLFMSVAVTIRFLWIAVQSMGKFTQSPDRPSRFGTQWGRYSIYWAEASCKKPSSKVSFIKAQKRAFSPMRTKSELCIPSIARRLLNGENADALLQKQNSDDSPTRCLLVIARLALHRHYSSYRSLGQTQPAPFLHEHRADNLYSEDFWTACTSFQTTSNANPSRKRLDL